MINLPQYFNNNNNNETNNNNLKSTKNKRKHSLNDKINYYPSTTNPILNSSSFDSLDIPFSKKKRFNNVNGNSNNNLNCLFNLEKDSRLYSNELLCNAIKNVYNITLNEKECNVILNKMNRPSKCSLGEIAIPCFTFCKKLKKNPKEIAEKLAIEINNILNNNNDLIDTNYISSVSSLNGYINVKLKTSYLGSIIYKILDKNNSFINSLPSNDENVMVEFSQPNTHKAFHVGHMRNVAIGDTMCRLYKHIGYNVTSANYYGDEGAHVAKCLWLLQKKIENGLDLDKSSEVPKTNRGEWLGNLYVDATVLLDGFAWTEYPFNDIIVGQITDIKKHPSDKAPKHWNVCMVKYDVDKDPVTVICGGDLNYKVNDYIGYTPVGKKYKGKPVVSKDCFGILSNGVIMGANELGLLHKLPKLEKSKEKKKEETKNEEKSNTDNNSNNKKSKKNKKNKKKEKKVKAKPDQRILILNNEPNVSIGMTLFELGRKRLNKLDVKEDKVLIKYLNDKLIKIDENKSMYSQFENYLNERNEILQKLESFDEYMCNLWKKTKQWSLDDFKIIYDWLDVTFDREFCESEVSEASKKLVLDLYNKNILKKSEGAIGLDLSDVGLGFGMVLKSDGTGLYLTKDLELAKRKFEEYKINKSIYVVDNSQELHFKQCFEILKRIGFKQANECYHLKYNLVTLPGGIKMSARYGTVILFSKLKQVLAQEINEKYLNELRNKIKKNKENDSKEDEKDFNDSNDIITENKDNWTEEEINKLEKDISVSSIRYGMLSIGPNKIIEFDLKKWTLNTGETGPYLQYQYARLNSIQKLIGYPSNEIPNFSLLNKQIEREILFELSQFQSIIYSNTLSHTPNALCKYLYNLCTKFSSWYFDKNNSIKHENNLTLKATRLLFCQAIQSVLGKGLTLIGIYPVERM